MDPLLFATSTASASVSFIVSFIFLRVYFQEHKSTRLLWALAYFLYACGHTIVSLISLDIIVGDAVLLWMWIYVNLGGSGTVGLILFTMFPFLTNRQHMREVIVLIFVILYSIGTALYAFVIPVDSIYAIINPFDKTHLNNMSWWVVIMVIPASFLVSYIFLNHYRVTRTNWGLFIGISFFMYAFILFIWPIQELKPLFYILRTVSVGLLGVGGILLARD